MLKISEIKLPLSAPPEALAQRVAKILKCGRENIKSVRITRKAVDSRKKDNIFFVYNVEAEVLDEAAVLAKSISNVSAVQNENPSPPELRRTSERRPVVAGFGPAGLFCALVLARAGLKPLILERGSNIDDRKKDVEAFWNKKILNTNSNIQFGEGGAGTFSDGKLTTGIKNPLCKTVFFELAAHGAPEEILYWSKPHIGTDKLGEVVKSIRREIFSLGGEVKFNCRMTDIIVANGSVHGISCTDDGGTHDIETDTLLLCIGHSARDTFEMLLKRGVNMAQKAFSMGARIEHPREMIDRAQYGSFAGHPALGAADYKMACHPPHGRGAYTFCMCPGGTVVSASSEESAVVVNGMSVYARNGENSNSALLVGLEPESFPSPHPLAGVYLQREIEQRAFELGGRSYAAPAQTVGDFLKNFASTRFGAVRPSCTSGAVPGNIRLVLPQSITDTMAGAIVEMDRRLTGFSMPEAVLTAPETRSSSPVRILRDELLQSNIRGLYPCGEGAGYAGGIVSAAVDGMRCAHAVMADEGYLW